MTFANARATYSLVLVPLLSCATLWVAALTIDVPTLIGVLSAVAVAVPGVAAFVMFRGSRLRSRLSHAGVAMILTVAAIVVVGFVLTLSLGDIGPPNN